MHAKPDPIMGRLKGGDRLQWLRRPSTTTASITSSLRQYTFAEKVAVGGGTSASTVSSPRIFEQFEATSSDLVDGGQVSMARTDDAARRILMRSSSWGCPSIRSSIFVTSTRWVSPADDALDCWDSIEFQAAGEEQPGRAPHRGWRRR